MMDGGARGPRVLIGFAESLPAPEVAWSLLDGGFCVVAVARRGSRPLVRRCRGVDVVPIEAPEVDAAAALRDLERVIATSRASLLFPLDDQTLWMCRELDLDSTIAAPSHDHARLGLDKRLQIARAEATGFAVPQTQIGSARKLERELGIPFPIILRPANAVEERAGRLTRTGAAVCADKVELDRALRQLADGCLIVQPWLEGISEGLFGLAKHGHVLAWSAHHRIRMVDPHGSGSSACVSIAVPTDVTAAAERFVEDVGWNGLFMFELLRDSDGVPWFVEFNGRAWGSMALARRIGFEYPAWAARTALNAETHVEPPPVRQGVVCRHLGLDLIHTAAVLRGPTSTALPWPSRWQTLRDVFSFRRGETWYNVRPGQRMLFVEDAAAAVSELFIRLLRRVQRNAANRSRMRAGRL
jgi:predicted ATP-grasp superfamily ATP-dependent carboligase